MHIIISINKPRNQTIIFFFVINYITVVIYVTKI
jgi:hypothetical protein